MKSDRGTVIVKTDIYKGAKAKLPILRMVLDILSLTAIVTFIVCNGYIAADKNVLILLDVILGIFAVLLLICMRKPIEEFLRLKQFYANADARNEYEFFANGVGIYQYRSGNMEDCEILSFSTLLKKWENKTYFCFMGNQFVVYVVDKSGLVEEELNAIRAALGLPFSGKKLELPTAELKIAPYIARIEQNEPHEDKERTAVGSEDNSSIKDT